MRHFVLLLLAALVFTAAPTRAQSGSDPGDLFVTAYMAVQQGEKAEQSGDLKGALSKLRSAATVLDQIATRYPNWQPQIVDYRKARTTEAIGRVQERIAKSGGGKTDAGNNTEPPPLPEPENGKPLIFEGGRTPTPPANGTPRGTAYKPGKQGANEADPLAEASQRMKKLQEDLQKAKDEAARLQSEKTTIARQLDEAAKTREASEQKQQVLQKRADIAEQELVKATANGESDSEKIKTLQAQVAANRRALRDLRIEADADTEYRKQLDDRFRKALQRIGQLTHERNVANDTSATVPGKIADIQKQLDQAKKEKDDLAAKLQKTEIQLNKVTSQRDDALAQVAKLQDAQKQIDKLVADNGALMAKLADADKTIKQFKLDGAEKDKQIASLKTEVGSLQQQLTQAKKESADYQRQMADMQTKLEESGKQLAAAKAENSASATEKKKMVEENSILRGIVLRQQKEEAVRAKTRKTVLEEMQGLELHSKSLMKQIEYLSQPVVKLTEKERSLFKKPELQISDSEIAIGGAGADAVKPPVATAPVEEPKVSTPAVPPVVVQTTPPPVPAPQPSITITPSAPTAPPPAPVVVVPAATPAPAPAPIVQTKPATPEPATPAKSKASDAGNVASNEKKAETPKSQPVEAAPLPAADKMISLTVNTPPTQPIQTAPSSIMASAKPLTNTPSLDKTPATTAPSSTAPASTGKPDSTAPPAGEAPAGESKMGGSVPNVPPELLPLAREGKDEFERGNYLEAEKIYRKILAKAPNNLYTLSNLGVVLFRANKLKPAEESFRKAIAVAPEDSFSHCTLGIVFYSQGKYDEAVNELTKTLQLDPKNATAHNYLGITCSQKGWQEAAQKELVTATAIDPNYADANFNLAVVFATQTPPDKENARKYYQRAIELGAERDAALEQLIK